MSKKKKKKRTKYLTQNSLMMNYGLTRSIIERFLPEPKLVYDRDDPNKAPIRKWKKSDVEAMLESHPDIRQALEEKRRRKEERAERALRKTKAADEYLQQFSPDDIIQQGRELSRHFVLHVGPTNSGKTFGSLERLRQAETGVYLGPLRLLALEVFENMNEAGVPCSLLTGEEFLDVPFSGITASTIELADYEAHYDVAVIDEAQMLADPERGPHWTRAICLIDADEVHICLAPEAEELVVMMLEKLEAPYEIERHDRLVPLKFSGLFREMTEIEPGDALIAFSRKSVLQLAAALEKTRIRASVIYGALPPQSRREEVRRFSAKETTVVVATDAIGMGISLPIRRVIFVDSEKFDGKTVRPLTATEIRQIAGRAGRFGKYDEGEVLTMSNPRLISQALEKPIEPIRQLTIGFPEEALDYDRPLEEMLAQWDMLPENELFAREDMRDAEYLLARIGKIPVGTPKSLVYSLITCPLDIKNGRLVSYWQDCCQHIFREEPVPRPRFREDTLENCELQYHAYDCYHQLQRRIGVEDECIEEKTLLSERINRFLRQKKAGFLKRCRICGRELRIQDRYSICDACFKREKEEAYGFTIRYRDD